MRYTIWSRGRLVGETDLAFARVMDEVRCGWFSPSAEGAPLLALATAVSPGLRALRGNAPAELPDLPEVRGSSYLADLAEAEHHLSSLELELRDDEGRVVATEDIGFQDTHVLLELAREAIEELDELESTDWVMQDDPDELFGHGTFEELSGDDPIWRLEVDPPPAVPFVDHWDDGQSACDERYQVIVTLKDPMSVP